VLLCTIRHQARILHGVSDVSHHVLAIDADKHALIFHLAGFYVVAAAWMKKAVQFP
jgi:hypothetical protein